MPPFCLLPPPKLHNYQKLELRTFAVFQACAFGDSYEKFKKAGAEVVGISGDHTTSHKFYLTKLKLR
ncbi:Alkyl hydroperoxide reductase subunit C/ Thiol specific antioxidant [Corchorus olitorius]|uniref:Alkyl hydroperoxide reductase subunit C/ Thiol specific antioxidant n=1 Tax=Corchorus olitorius TaxID=93759 RepID=A0A1R3INZ2_9ROSI|nr:Alkyl hydroperoxide reductase subunit C/ Thiol specific antioxidant [Corchorus olitorius]